MRRCVLALAVVLAACGGTGPTPPADPTTTLGTVATTTEAPPPTNVVVPPTTVPPDITVPPPQTGETPAELLDRILADAAERTGVGDLEVIRDEAVVWSDGSLGCPEPGVEYLQALVPGYWVEIDASGTRLDYRAGESGFFRLCEGADRRPPAPIDPDR